MSEVLEVADKQADKQAYENNKLHKRLCRLVGQALVQLVVLVREFFGLLVGHF